eukprot:CAMPEP_0202877512 /NCGR_PEP_ID=MMETSP1391-20130828/30764_1 /ASSEMBLY_ACC=CAM_ASM_000867 /TAXON_ID=1034604 /ORGANISM="Chlamydomonas leiostraca, Strain SAG 11-49" /LENGTH=211 /DNA_ID=CAMNT_0049559559 /DNA_START=148 /DNA_END=779 /DNA_ORIENTATION=-
MDPMESQMIRHLCEDETGETWYSYMLVLRAHLFDGDSQERWPEYAAFAASRRKGGVGALGPLSSGTHDPLNPAACETIAAAGSLLVNSPLGLMHEVELLAATEAGYLANAVIDYGMANANPESQGAVLDHFAAVDEQISANFAAISNAAAPDPITFNATEDSLACGLDTRWADTEVSTSAVVRKGARIFNKVMDDGQTVPPGETEEDRIVR